mgnify:CR=1 FL=1
MIDPKTREFIRRTIRSYLPDPSYRLFLFGSRTQTHHHPYSDVDIGIEGRSRVSAKVLADIEEALEESDLPVRVGVVDFISVASDFRRIAQMHAQSL